MKFKGIKDASVLKMLLQSMLLLHLEGSYIAGKLGWFQILFSPERMM